jgi:hypothetical protein
MNMPNFSPSDVTPYFWRCQCQQKNIRYFTFDGCTKCDSMRDVSRQVTLGEAAKKCPSYHLVTVNDVLTIIAKEVPYIELLLSSTYGPCEETVIIDEHERDLLYDQGNCIVKIVKLARVAGRI